MGSRARLRPEGRLDCRGGGLRAAGRTLLAHLERQAKEQGVEELRLDTDGGNPAALALFRASGFHETPDYNGNPHARHWFAKRLNVIE